MKNIEFFKFNNLKKIKKTFRDNGFVILINFLKKNNLNEL